MKETIYVVPHKNPDMDSIVSSIVLTYILNHKEGRKGDNSHREYFCGITEEIDEKRKKKLNSLLKILKEDLQYRLLKSIEIDNCFKKIEVNKEKNLKVVLVDHFQESHFQKGIKPENVIGVFDHHTDHVSDTDFPNLEEDLVWCRITGADITNIVEISRRWKSLSNIKSKFWEECLIALVSDTNNLKSNITDLDLKLAEELCKVNKKRDRTKICDRIFERMMEISDSESIELDEVEERLESDFKRYSSIKFGEESVKVGVSSIKISGHTNLDKFSNIVENEEYSRKIFKDFMDKNDIDFLYVMLISVRDDPIFTDLYLINKEELDDTKNGFNTFYNYSRIEKLQSRKSQLVPFIEENGVTPPIHMRNF